jgi:RNA polymerase sigma factor (sigma-70 family)
VLDEVIDTDNTNTAFEVFFSESYDLILSYACKRLGTSHDAEELVHEVFVNVYAGLREQDPSTIVDFKAWLFTIAKRVVNEYCQYKQQKAKHGKQSRRSLAGFKYRLKAIVSDRIKNKLCFIKNIIYISLKHTHRPKRYRIGRVNTDEEASPCFSRHATKILYLKQELQIAACLYLGASSGA